MAENKEKVSSIRVTVEYLGENGEVLSITEKLIPNIINVDMSVETDNKSVNYWSYYPDRIQGTIRINWEAWEYKKFWVAGKRQPIEYKPDMTGLENLL